MLLQMVERLETQFGRKLTPEELYLAARAHELGMTYEQAVEAVDRVNEPTPEPPPPETHLFESVGQDVQRIPGSSNPS